LPRYSSSCLRPSTFRDYLSAHSRSLHNISIYAFLPQQILNTFFIFLDSLGCLILFKLIEFVLFCWLITESAG
jgi:hypothetical protein